MYPSIPTFSVKKGDVYSAKVLKALENIDDECDENGIIFIKVGALTFSFEPMSLPFDPRLEKSRKQRVLELLTYRHLSILNPTYLTSTKGISGKNKDICQDSRTLLQGRTGCTGLAPGAINHRRD